MTETASSPDFGKINSPSSAEIPQEAIRRRAEDIYIRTGRIAGRDVQNWTQAEQEIAQESKRAKPPQAELAGDPSPARRAVIVRVNGVKYVGEYREESSEGYVPGEFAPETPVTLRFSGDRMFVKRPNGKELETVIVEKTG